MLHRGILLIVGRAMNLRRDPFSGLIRTTETRSRSLKNGRSHVNCHSDTVSRIGGRTGWMSGSFGNRRSQLLLSTWRANVAGTDGRKSVARTGIWDSTLDFL